MSKMFDRKVSKTDLHNSLLQHFGAKLNPEEMEKLTRIHNNWNFYEGYHWEGVESGDKPQVTVNYIRAFVDKQVAFELGDGFKIKMKPDVEDIDNENDPLEFLNQVWEDNNKLERCAELGQTKAITGDGWIQVAYEPKFLRDNTRNPDFFDPFDEFEKGKIKIIVLPTAIVFPQYTDFHDKDNMKSLTIMYPVLDTKEGIFRKAVSKHIIYKQVWTDKFVEVYMGENLISRIPNKYGIIPFRQIKNLPNQGKTEGISDVEDIIPLNMEINLKKSDISEIIDYHSAPITIVFGARVSQLERGANKVWGGLPKDAKVENLRLDGDLSAAQNYTADLKKEMHEVGGVPEGVLGGDLAISNTSGIALQIALKPILDRVKMKRVMTKEGLEHINKLILLIAEKEGLISVPEGISRKDYFHNEVYFDSPLPKDTLLELQEIELEMRMGLESREGAMKRTGKDNIKKRIAEIDKDMEDNPTLYGKEDMDEKVALIREQAKVSRSNSIPSSTTRKVGENKEGNPKQVNAGYQNSPEPKR